MAQTNGEYLQSLSMENLSLLISKHCACPPNSSSGSSCSLPISCKECWFKWLMEEHKNEQRDFDEET